MGLEQVAGPFIGEAAWFLLGSDLRGFHLGVVRLGLGKGVLFWKPWLALKPFKRAERRSHGIQPVPIPRKMPGTGPAPFPGWGGGTGHALPVLGSPGGAWTQCSLGFDSCNKGE